LITRLADEISGWQIPPVHAGVYGAVARGDGDLDSDVDLLLIRPDHLDSGDVVWEDQAGRLMQTVVDLTGNPAHVFELSRTELKDHVTAEDPILNDWPHPNLQVTGLPLATLLELDTDRHPITVAASAPR
jgi:predicted nucleotidyltransferase